MNVQELITGAKLTGPVPQPDGTTVFEFQFPADATVFAGHFPGRPILPGVFQPEMARAAAQWTLDCSLGIREISKAKFQRPILPGETLRLQLKLTETDAAIQARASFSVAGRPAGETLLQLWRNA